MKFEARLDLLNFQDANLGWQALSPKALEAAGAPGSKAIEATAVTRTAKCAGYFRTEFAAHRPGVMSHAVCLRMSWPNRSRIEAAKRCLSSRRTRGPRFNFASSLPKSPPSIRPQRISRLAESNDSTNPVQSRRRVARSPEPLSLSLRVTKLLAQFVSRLRGL